MSNHICGDPNSACDAECMERAHRAELRTKDTLLWISLADQLPAKDEPHFLVTNNLEARNAHGHRSHVWLVHMVHEHEPGDRTIHDRDAYQEFGRFSAFDDADQRIRGLTHWASIREYFE